MSDTSDGLSRSEALIKRAELLGVEQAIDYLVSLQLTALEASMIANDVLEIIQESTEEIEQ